MLSPLFPLIFHFHCILSLQLCALSHRYWEGAEQEPSTAGLGHGLRLRQERFKLDIRKNFFRGMLVKALEGAAQGVVECPPLEVWLCDETHKGLGDLENLFQIK